MRIYPCAEDPNQSVSQISFYIDQKLAESDDPAHQEFYRNVTDRMQGFAEVIRDEDYAAAASSHLGAASGAQDHVIFGRNEPALHHYHNTYRHALGLEPLEAVD